MFDFYWFVFMKFFVSVFLSITAATILNDSWRSN